MIKEKIIINNNSVLTIEAGEIANQTSSSLLISSNGTKVLITIVCDKNETTKKDYLPLKVDYQERFYANGKIPGGFFKRESKPTEREILISRLIDRSVRPLFPKDFFNEVQIIATVISINKEINPDILSIIGASLALCLSEIPIYPIGSTRIGKINNNYIINPSTTQLELSDMDLIISGTENCILMIESKSKEITNDDILTSINIAHNNIKEIIKFINTIIEKYGTKKKIICNNFDNMSIIYEKYIENKYKNDFEKALKIIEKQDRKNELQEIYKKINDDDYINNSTNIVNNIIKKIESKIITKNLIIYNKRIDGRKNNEIRNINIKTKILENTHGSALFTRGETQALVSVTLGSEKDAQIIDNPFIKNYKENFILHYNFQPFCVGEISSMIGPKRREIGHGNLIKKGLETIIPNADIFPYVIRIVSEITSSNGSSSMASVCGSSIALMEAGIPIKEHVAGISIGLIQTDTKIIVLSDILGDEDHLGDMDFKIIGTINGITALQMDVKNKIISKDIIKLALKQGKEGINYIISLMKKFIDKPKETICKFAPQIMNIQINKDKIKNLIGKGGQTIKSLTEKHNVNINVQNNGNIQITTNNNTKLNELIEDIKKITENPKEGKIYTGTVTKISDFGTFINILPGKDGLLYKNENSNNLKIAQKIQVKISEIDSKGRIKLTTNI